jgi:uncharacterized repeat protein (TIGR01451 family)
MQKRWLSNRWTVLGAMTLSLNLAIAFPAGAAPRPAKASPRTADLEIRTVEWSESVTVGEEFFYRMMVSNNGPDSADRIVFDDSMPSELSLVSVTTTQGTCSGDTSAHCDLGTLASAGTADVTVTVRADREGTVTNAASVSSQRSDPNTSNNGTEATTTISSSHDDSSTDAFACGAPLEQAWGGTCELSGAGGPVSVSGSVVDLLPYGGCQGYPLCVYPNPTTVKVWISVSTRDGTVLASCTNSSAGSAACAGTSSEPVEMGTALFCSATAWDSHGHALKGEFACVAAP